MVSVIHQTFSLSDYYLKHFAGCIKFVASLETSYCRGWLKIDVSNLNHHKVVKKEPGRAIPRSFATNIAMIIAPINLC